MKNRSGEQFYCGLFSGSVIASSDQFALISFKDLAGFVSLATQCDGNYPLVMTVGLPVRFLDTQTVHEIQCALLEFFECDRPCLIVTAVPRRVASIPSYMVSDTTLSKAAGDMTQHVFDPEPIELFSFPRRFDLASMMAISTSYALLFALMQFLMASPAFMFATGGLFAAVAVGQAVLFGGESPRGASLLVGGLYCAIVGGAITAQSMRYIHEVVGFVCFALFWGPPAGYLAGGLVAGIFLIAEYGRRAAAGRREDESGS